MENAKWLSSLARRAPMPVLGVDADGRITYVNDSLCALTGRDREQVVGRFFWDILAGKQAEHWQEAFDRNRADGIVNRADTRVPTVSGDELLIAWHNVTFLDANGDLEAVYSIGADITALRNAENRLARLNATLQALSGISGLALRTDDPHQLLVQACEILVDTGACTGAWIAPVGDDRRPVGLVGSSLRDGGAPGELRSAVRDLPDCITDVIDRPRQAFSDETSANCEHCVFAPHEPDVHGLVTSITCGGEVLGALITHVHNSRPVAEETQRLICSVADDLGFALAMLEARAMHERTEQSLAERTRMLDAFFESSLDPAAILDPDFNFVRVNDAYAKSCDRSPAELIGLNHFDLFPHDENQAIFEHVRDTGETYRIQARPFEFPDHPEWGVTWWDWALVPTLDGEGQVAFITLWLRDVTEQQRAKEELEAQRDRLDELVHERTEKLQESNELLRAVLDESPVAISVHDVDGTITMWNAAAEQLSGWKAEEVVGGTSPLVAPEQQEESESLFAAILGGGPINDVPVRRVHRDGSVMDLRLSAAPLRDSEGNVTGVAALFRDETERLAAERELRQTNELLKAILHSSPVAIVVHDVRGNVTMWNPGAEEISGWSAEEVVGGPPPLVPPDKQEEFRRNLEQLAAGEAIRAVPFERQRRDGKRVQLELSAAPLHDSDGEYVGSVVLFSDVTDREEAVREQKRLMDLLEQHADHLEEMVADRTRELLRSRDQLRRQRDFVAGVVEKAGSIVVVVDADGKIVRFNETAQEVSGFSSDDVVGRDFIEVLLPEDEHERVRQDFTLDRNASGWQYESWWLSHDGERRLISWRVSVIADQQGEMEFMIGSGWDVTEERRMARELRESEEKYRELVENARTIIVRWDRDGTIRFMNEYGLELFGYEEDEIVGRHVSMLVPDVASDGVHLGDLADAIIRRPEDYWINENENIAKDGTRYWVSWSNRLIRDEDGEVQGIMAIGVDRTAQRRAEEQLLASQLDLRDLTAELAMAEQRERREIATLLHDSVGQLLAFAKLRLGAMADRSEELGDDLATVLHYIDEAIDETRSLTTQLSPPALEQLGFVAALQWLADELSERHGVPIGFVAEADPAGMTEDIGVTLFQAVRELIINAIKHAKAEQVSVKLLLKDGCVCLEVSDDGVGFEPEAIRGRRENGGGFGLFNVRERLTYLGGDVAIETAPGAGATITLICPINSRETTEP